MLTVTAGVLLMLLVITPDGYHRAGWAELGLYHAGWRYWPLALLDRRRCSSPRTAR
jgi:hypothetical protein